VLQQDALPVIGFLNTGLSDAFASRVAAFREGRRESGYIELSRREKGKIKDRGGGVAH
jgi:hypothetical protein